MAVKYVYSAAAGAGTGADWANAYTTLALAFAGMVAGDTAYVAHDHTETQASAMTLTSPGTAASPCNVLCVNRSGSVPPVSADLLATATITTTGNNAITFSTSQGTYYYGIIFSAGSGAASVAMLLAGASTYASCSLRLGGTTGGTMTLGGSACRAILINTSVQFASVSSSILPARLVWRKTAAALLGTAPTNLFLNNDRGSYVFCEAVDFSAAGSGKTLVTTGLTGMQYIFKDCKLGSFVTITGTPTGTQPSIDLIRCDSGNTNYRHERYSYAGTQTVETTIVRTGGASDGTTPIAWKIVTTANSKWAFPFESMPITFWNEVVGSAIAVEIEGIWGGGAVPNNDEIWLEAEYLGASGDPQGSFVSGSKADILAAGVALSAGAGTWGGSTTKFKMSATFTSQQKGPVTLYVKAAKASSTFYIDPKPTGVALGKSFIVAPGVYANERAFARAGLHPIEQGIAA